MKKLLIPALVTGVMVALTSISGTAFALGGGGDGSGGGRGGHFVCTSDPCFSGILSGGGGAGGHLSDGTVFGGGHGGRLTCDFETGCVGVGGDGGKP